MSNTNNSNQWLDNLEKLGSGNDMVVETTLKGGSYISMVAGLSIASLFLGLVNAVGVVMVKMGYSPTEIKNKFKESVGVNDES